MFRPFRGSHWPGAVRQLGRARRFPSGAEASRGDLDSLRDITHLQGYVDARTLVDLDDHLWPSEVLKASFFCLNLVPARVQIHEGV